MNYSKNRELTAKTIFESLTQINDFKTIDYAVHKDEKCFCDCFKFEFSVQTENAKVVDEYLKSNGVTEIEQETLETKNIYQITMASNKIRNCFNDLYSQCLPSIQEHGNLYKIDSPRKNIILYKLKNDEKLKHKILDKDLCKLTKSNSEIERSLYLSIQSIVCFVEGTGCRCSQIQPLESNEFKPEYIIKVIKEVENATQSTRYPPLAR